MKTIDIRVNKELIMKYKPCLDGLANFNTHYTDISIKELINTENISYDHKLWLLKKIVSSDLLALWAIDSAFAAYAYSNFVSNDYYDQADAAYYACYAADYAANAADSANYAADYADYAANYAIRASGYACISANDAEKERLQALLYFIEGE